MMGRMIKLLRSFPRIVFQPINHAIVKRRTTKKRNGRNPEDASPPTLHLPASYSKSSGGVSPNYANNQNQPMIRIRRARSVKPNEKGSLKIFSASETNLMTFPEDKNNRLLLSYDKEKSCSVSTTNLNNNSIISKNQYNTNTTQDGPNKNRKSFWKGSESKVKSSADIPRIVAEVISESCSGRVRLERQMIRLINGADPSVQSQVLLNTKTSQPWEDLVRELGMAVRLPRSRKIGNRLETLYGRQVGSYSQLRSELKVGNNTFYIYVDMNDDEDEDSRRLLPNLQRQRLSVTPEPHPISDYYRVKRSTSNVTGRRTTPPKQSLGATLSNSSSELSTTFASTRYLDIPNYRDNHSQGAGSQKPRRHNKRRSRANSTSTLTSPSTPTSPIEESFHLPPIDVHLRRSKSPSSLYRRQLDHHPLNFLEPRSVHFK